MVELPPRGPIHLWLRYAVEGYTEDIVHDFEQRLDTIFSRQGNRVYILDFAGLTEEMGQALTDRMGMVYTGEEGQVLFTSHAWRRDPVRRLCHRLISFSISGRAQALEKDSPTKETETESNVWDDGSEDVNPFGERNPLLTKKTKSEPIIWDIGGEEEEYPFVNKYPSFQEEPIMLGEEESCPVYDTNNEDDAEPAPKYDFDRDELVYEDEEVCLHDVGNSFLVSSEAGSHLSGHSSNNYNFEKRASSSHAESKSSVEHPEPEQEKRSIMADKKFMLKTITSHLTITTSISSNMIQRA
nr:F-box domain, galactose oxidase, beta-propeller [Tanacetum cinerariifolium]